MNKLRTLLLPLALVFGAIAIFETGARYGATNMRAYAISQQLHSLTQIRISIQNEENENTSTVWARFEGPRCRWYLAFESSETRVASSISKTFCTWEKRAEP